MRILMLGDVVGEGGRRLVEAFVPELRREARVDFVVVNGENAAHGHGITERIARQWLDELGVDVITTGNHAFDVKEASSLFAREPRLLRPANWPPDTPGAGWVKLHTPSAEEVLVVNLLGRVELPPCDCPFRAVDAILARERADLVLVDFHAEATSEKLALAYYLDGRVSALWGTHTHVPTADERVFPKGTGYITDLGMTGPVESVLGICPEQSIEKFLGGMPGRYRAAEGPSKAQGAIFSLDSATGLCVAVERVDIR